MTNAHRILPGNGSKSFPAKNPEHRDPLNYDEGGPGHAPQRVDGAIGELPAGDARVYTMDARQVGNALTAPSPSEGDLRVGLRNRYARFRGVEPHGPFPIEPYNPDVQTEATAPDLPDESVMPHAVEPAFIHAIPVLPQGITVNEPARPYRFSTMSFPVVAAADPIRLVGRNLSRKDIAIVNAGSNTMWIGSNSMEANPIMGFPLTAGQTIVLDTTWEIYVYSTLGTIIAALTQTYKDI